MTSLEGIKSEIGPVVTQGVGGQPQLYTSVSTVTHGMYIMAC